jgi:hypothetical protein
MVLYDMVWHGVVGVRRDDAEGGRQVLVGQRMCGADWTWRGRSPSPSLRYRWRADSVTRFEVRRGELDVSLCVGAGVGRVRSAPRPSWLSQHERSAQDGIVRWC